MKKILFCLCGMPASLLFAQTPIMTTAEEGNRLMQEAQEQWEAAQKTCAEKFLVNACLSAAQQTFKEKYNAGKNLQQTAKKQELTLRKEKYAEKLKKQEEKIRNHQKRLEEKYAKKIKK